MHNSDIEVFKLVNVLFTKPEFKDSMLKILAKLQEEGNLDSIHSIYLMRNILYVFSKHIEEQTEALILTREQFELLYHELLKIIIELNKSNTQKIIDATIELIIKRFFLALQKTVKERHKHKKEENVLSKEDMKEIQENLRKAIIYEIYKFTNPRTIAGETRLDNFINNLLKGGVAYARKFDINTTPDIEQRYTNIVRGQRNSGKSGRGK